MTRKLDGERIVDSWPVEVFPDEELYSKLDDDTFHIGQSYDEVAVSVLVCRKCGGREFNVGRGSYYTAIRCVKCEWEACVHSG